MKRKTRVLLKLSENKPTNLIEGILMVKSHTVFSFLFKKQYQHITFQWPCTNISFFSILSSHRQLFKENVWKASRRNVLSLLLKGCQWDQVLILQVFFRSALVGNSEQS